MKRDSHDQGSGNGNGLPCSSWSDRELVRHLQDHQDDRSLELLYTRHRSQLQQCARKVLQDEQLAGDVAQEILLRLWKNPEKLDGERNPLSLLRRMAHDLAVDLVRREKWVQPMEQDFERSLGIAIGTSMNLLEKAELWACVQACLTLAQYRMIELRFLYGFSINECAAKEGVTPGTVKRLIHNSLKKLQTERILSTFLPSNSAY